MDKLSPAKKEFSSKEKKSYFILMAIFGTIGIQGTLSYIFKSPTSKLIISIFTALSLISIAVYAAIQIVKGNKNMKAKH